MVKREKGEINEWDTEYQTFREFYLIRIIFFVSILPAERSS